MVNLNLQRRLAAQILKCGEEKIRFDPASLNEIKESITKADIKGLIGEGYITLKYMPGSSRGRARIQQVQKSKGLRKGKGSRKGTSNARQSVKESWINRIRKQRRLLKEQKNKEMITNEDYRMI